MHGLKLGTRGSPLALAQARKVAAAIEAAQRWPEGFVELVPLTTSGDKIQDRPLSELGGKGLWTKELDKALIAGELSFCVHSMKDVESVRPKEIHIAAVRPRGDVRDRIIGADSIDQLKQGAVVGMECRTNDTETQSVLTTVNNQITYWCVMAERAFTRALGATCASPVAAFCVLEDGDLRMRFLLYSEAGSEMVEERALFDCGDNTTPESLAREMLAKAPESIR